MYRLPYLFCLLTVVLPAYGESLWYMYKLPYLFCLLTPRSVLKYSGIPGFSTMPGKILQYRAEFSPTLVSAPDISILKATFRARILFRTWVFSPWERRRIESCQFVFFGKKFANHRHDPTLILQLLRYIWWAHIIQSICVVQLFGPKRMSQLCDWAIPTSSRQCSRGWFPPLISLRPYSKFAAGIWNA